jgi:hypothetical protein
MVLEFSRRVFEKFSNFGFHENPSSGSRVVPFGRTDRHDGANSRFSQFCDRAYKWDVFHFYATRYLQFKISLDFNIDAFFVLSFLSRHSWQLTSDVTGFREWIIVRNTKLVSWKRYCIVADYHRRCHSWWWCSTDFFWFNLSCLF